MSYSAPYLYILKWKARNFIRNLNPLRKKDSSSGISGMTIYNRILDDAARRQYEAVIKKLFMLVPEIMNRKISEANIQQAFVLDTVQKFAGHLPQPTILAIGCFEDSSAEALWKLGYRVKGIDPVLNFDLETFFFNNSFRKIYYDIIFSTSVIEHVENDELFISRIAQFLAPGGTAIITCDYNDRYRQGDPLPKEDFRLYTQKDFKERFLPVLRNYNCSLVDTPQWDCSNPDFTYAGCKYTFATFVFRKNNR